MGYHGKKELKIKIADSTPATASPTLASLPNGRVTFWNGAGDTATKIYSVIVNSSSYVSVWVRGESVSSAAGVDRVKVGSKEVPVTVVKVDFTIEMVDEEPTPDPKLTARDTSDLDMDTLCITLNGNEIASSAVSITDVYFGGVVTGKKVMFTAPPGTLNLPASNQVKVNVEDNAGNSMDEVSNSFSLP